MQNHLTAEERSPRKIYYTEHEQLPPGSHPAPLLHLHVTPKRCRLHHTVQQRRRFMAHLEREFKKGMQKIEDAPLASIRGTMKQYYFSAEEKAAERSSMMKDSSSMAGPSSAGDAPNLGSTPPRAAAAGTRAGKQPVVKLDSPKSAKKLKLG